MQFDSHDIESKMKSSRNESVGALATLGFYLNVLFFKISMDLDTDVRFFKDSAHIPMVLTTPVDARKRLHAMSGVLYSFVLSDIVSADREILMPALTAIPSATSEGLKHCIGEICEFKLRMNTIPGVNKSFSMELRIPKRLVEFGMFPQFVPDVGAMSKIMRWTLPKAQLSQKRVGLYLEVSGLPEGEHPWEFWMDLGGDKVM
ncbi:MAG: hypothetical protein NTV34_15330, partial [Proteobacteria bacterium]|nr:hypothetical protein [Pseudomonadota bacterium]